MAPALQELPYECAHAHAGDWLETVSTMQRLAPEVLLKADRGGYTPQEFSSAEGGMWSAGVVLYELATCRWPFPGSLPSGRTLASQDVLPQEERTELFKNVLGQLCRYEVDCLYILTVVNQELCLCFLAHDKPGTCRASLACPEQFVLSIPARSFSKTICPVV